MKERTDILKLNRQMLNARVDAAMATVVRVQGSAYRRPGARMLIGANGQITGGVSGGCLERDVILRAGGVMASRQPALVRYDTAIESEGGGYSLGCGGVIDILIEPLRTPAGVELSGWLNQSMNCSVALATVISKQHLSARLGDRLFVSEAGSIEGLIANENILLDARQVLESGRSRFAQYGSNGGLIEVFIEFLRPPLKLFVFGAGNDAVPLTRFAKSLGWHVTLVDVRSTPFDPGRMWEVDAHVRCAIGEVRESVLLDENAAAVVMTHNVTHDGLLIEWLGQRSLGYLGLLGPRHRTEQILGDATVERLRSPVGLDLGADHPEEVALAIVAEITAVMHGRPGGSLSDSAGPIHVTGVCPAVEAKTAPVENLTCAVAGS